MRPTYAVINLSNLKKNYLNIRKKTKNVKIMAVVKADAYGHGLEQIVKTLNSLGEKKPEYFAVAICEEAIELRELNVQQPILVFDPIDFKQVEEIFQFNLIPTIYSNSHLSTLKQGIKSYRNKYGLNEKLPVQIKVDTGMNRLGIDHDKAFNLIKKVSQSKDFLIDGIYTHFATSDEKDKTFANLQLKRFNDLLLKLKNEKINYGLAHAANSGAILDMPEAYFDMVRPGISLYGYYPSLETSKSIELKPIMSIVSQVTSVKEIQAGESVSYGRLFISKRKTKIINVPIGYADGYNRQLTNKAKAIIKGKFYNQVGRVAMDRIMFDVGNDNIKTGDKVILLGEKNNLKFDAWDWSKIINSIPYEVTCNISKRVPRFYKE
jgi:alanine racemase